MIVRIGDNYVAVDSISSMLKTEAASNATAGQFEFKASTKVTLKDGQSFVVPMSSDKLAEDIQEQILESGGDSSPLNNQLEELIKQLTAINENLKYMAEMGARLSMHITDGKEIIVRMSK